jgi:hypothetical protein
LEEADELAAQANSNLTSNEITLELIQKMVAWDR